jgi:hypothetical protein
VLGCRRALDNLPQIISRLNDVCCIADNQLDELPKPGLVGQTRVGGIDINKSRIRTVIDAVVSLAPKPHGFTSSELAQAVQARMGSESDYTPRKAAYDLKKLRGKNLIRKIGPKPKNQIPVDKHYRNMQSEMI